MSKNRRTRLLVLGVGFVVGAVGGWMYWRFVGCLNGACMIWSNAWIAAGYGGVLGWLLAGLLPFGLEKKTKTEPAPETADALTKEG